MRTRRLASLLRSPHLFTEEKRSASKIDRGARPALEGDASRELQFALRVQLCPGDLAVVRISQDAIGVGELRRVRYVESVAVQFQNIAFLEREILLHRYIRGALTRSVKPIPADCSKPSEDILSIRLHHRRTRERRRIEPRSSDALRITHLTYDVRTIGIRCATAGGKIERIAGSNSSDDVQLPAADGEISEVICAARKTFARSKRQLIQDRRAEYLPLILERITVVCARIVVK